jgi:hypothetical protein
MDETVFLEESGCSIDEIIASNERRVVTFQRPKDMQCSRDRICGDQDRRSKYEYTQLEDFENIRLLRYSSTADSNEVVFDLKEIPLAKASDKFVAVSYCWVKGLWTERLPLANGACLKVSRSVISILRHVAGIASGLPIWIDAICINQADGKEKSSQVGMMRQIYARARCVFVWLADGNINQDDELRLYSSLKPAYPFYSTTFPTKRVSTEDRDGDAVFGKILQSPWFARVWVVQEFSYARNVFFLCGMIGMSLPFLKDYLDLKRKNCKTIPETYFISSEWGQVELPAFERVRKLFGARDLIRQNYGKPVYSLTDVLLSFQASESEDPRDKVFALLGLATRHQVKPNYALSKETTFMEAMIACTPSLNDYRLLGYAGLANPRFYQEPTTTDLATMPTWVPDFSSPFFIPPFTKCNDFQATPARDQASPEKERQLLQGEDVKTLALPVQISLIDYIEELSLSGCCAVGSLSPDDQTIVKCQYDISREGIKMLKDRNPTESATLKCCEAMTAGGLRHYDMTEVEKVALLEAFQELEDAASYSSRSEENGHISKLHAHMYLSGIGRSRRLFVTSKGYFGVANNGIQKDDLVCLISEAPVPFIFRGLTGPRTYNLVCDAYLHGFMLSSESNVPISSFKDVWLE